MKTERGRGLVLVDAARLDLAPEHLRKAAMAPSADPDNKLFTPERSLVSYSAKISLATRLDQTVAQPHRCQGQRHLGIGSLKSIRQRGSHQSITPTFTTEVRMSFEDY